MKRAGIPIIYPLILLCIMILLPSAALAQVAGKITKVEGGVDILKSGTAAAVPIKLNDSISIGDILRTKSDGKAEITFVDNSVMTVGPKSRLGIEEYLFNPDAEKRAVSVKLHRGKMGFNVPKPLYSAEGSKFEMKTRSAVAGIRGTAGILITGIQADRLYISNGLGALTNRNGTALATPGTVAESFAGRPPSTRPFSQSEFNSHQSSLTITPRPSGGQGQGSGGGSGGQSSGGSGSGGQSAGGAGAPLAGDVPVIPASTGGPGGNLGSVPGTVVTGSGAGAPQNAIPPIPINNNPKIIPPPAPAPTPAPTNSNVNINVNFPAP